MDYSQFKDPALYDFSHYFLEGRVWDPPMYELRPGMDDYIVLQGETRDATLDIVRVESYTPNGLIVREGDSPAIQLAMWLHEGWKIKSAASH